MATTDVPFRTPMFDAKGAMSRTWILFFQGLGSGSGGGTAGSSATYLVPVSGGVATPDASYATNILVLTANTQVAAAANYSTTAGVDTPWSLVIQQDPAGGTGGWATTFDATYFLNIAIATSQSPTNTQCHIDFKTKPSGNTYLAGAPSIDEPIAS